MHWNDQLEIPDGEHYPHSHLTEGLHYPAGCLPKAGVVACMLHPCLPCSLLFGSAESWMLAQRLLCWQVTDPSPPRHMKFPRNLAPLTCLRYIDVACREIPVPLGTLPHLKCLTLRGLRPSCRGSHDAERVSAATYAL